MATSSVIPGYKAALVAALAARAGLSATTVAYAWPGPSATAEMIACSTSRSSQDFANIKAGRKHRNEDAEIDAVVWVFQGGGTPVDADDTEARSFAMAAEVEGELADDPTLGGVCEWSRIARVEAELVPFEKGWASQLILTLAVRARLT